MTNANRTTAYSLDETDGDAYWFAGALTISKATSQQTGGAFSLHDQIVPPGYAPPRQRHLDEDEAWYLLQGDVTFYCGTRTLSGRPGTFVFLPRGVEHTFQVGDRPARMLTLSVPSKFGEFVGAAGAPAPQLAPPPPGESDPEQLGRIAARFGIEILGPPPR